MDNEQIPAENQDQAHNLDPFDADFGARISAIVEAKVAKALDGLDVAADVSESLEGMNIEALIHSEIDKALSKIEHRLAHAREHAQRAQEKASRVRERMQRVKEKASCAHERMQRAEEKASRAAERAARRAEQRGHHIDVKVASAPQAQPDRAPAQPKVSDEDQLSILRMLQEGTITADQAEMLLAALTG